MQWDVRPPLADVRPSTQDRSSNGSSPGGTRSNGSATLSASRPLQGALQVAVAAGNWRKVATLTEQLLLAGALGEELLSDCLIKGMLPCCTSLTSSSCSARSSTEGVYLCMQACVQSPPWPCMLAGLCASQSFSTAWKAYLVSQQRGLKLAYGSYQALMHSALQVEPGSCLSTCPCPDSRCSQRTAPEEVDACAIHGVYAGAACMPAAAPPSDVKRAGDLSRPASHSRRCARSGTCRRRGCSPTWSRGRSSSAASHARGAAARRLRSRLTSCGASSRPRGPPRPMPPPALQVRGYGLCQLRAAAAKFFLVYFCKFS